MKWSEIRKAYPNTWLVIEALEAHSDAKQRVLDRIAVVESCEDGPSAFQSYQRLHHEHPWRELYYVHTGREALDIRERHWVGIRRNYGFAINGILGMNVPIKTDAIIDLRQLTIDA
jgi:hypothetical protein